MNSSNLLTSLISFLALWGMSVQAEESLRTKIEEKFPLPQFPSLAELTDNWSRLPELKSPKFIIVSTDTTYDLLHNERPVGQITGFAGHHARLLEFKDGLLTVTHQPNQRSRAKVKLSDTNLRTILEEEYAQQQEAAINAVKATRERELAQALEGEELNYMFEWKGDPRFEAAALFLAEGKLESGFLSEAKRWLWIGETEFEGESFDSILVEFEVDTIFGIFPNSMICLLEDGEVFQWIDTATKEIRD
ncbi:MAG: hypothetical protein AAGH89_09850 [Verrucomicrobiota bacterium]